MSFLAELSALSKLKSLDLSRNEFSELSKLQGKFVKCLSIAFIQNKRFCLHFAGYKSVRRLRNLKILDLSENNFDNNIFSFLSALTSLTTLFLRSSYIGGPFPVKGVCFPFHIVCLSCDVYFVQLFNFIIIGLALCVLHPVCNIFIYVGLPFRI